MNYKIVQKEAFNVYGIEGIFDMKDGSNLREIPKFWSALMKNGEYDKLVQSANYPSTLNAICCYRDMEGTKFPYMICSLETPLSDTSGYTVVSVPASTWAILSNEPHPIEETSSETQKLISRVYTDWLPTANYEIIHGYEFEMYYYTSDGKCYEESWIRVTPK